MLNHYTTKMTGPLETWVIHLSFLRFYSVIQGRYSFVYCQNPLFTKIQSNIAIWQYIVQYGIDPYCFTPNMKTCAAEEVGVCWGITDVTVRFWRKVFLNNSGSFEEHSGKYEQPDALDDEECRGMWL